MRNKSKSRIGAVFEKNTAVHLKDYPIDWASDMHVQCGSDSHHHFSLTKGNAVNWA